MSMWLFVLSITFACVVAMAVFAKIVWDGGKDDLAYPLAECDVSMFDELRGEAD